MAAITASSSLGLEGRDVEDRAEDLFLHLGDAGDLEDDGGDEGALPRRLQAGAARRRGRRTRRYRPRTCCLAADVDDRAEIGVEGPRVADRQLVHGAVEHFEGAFGAVSSCR